MLLNNFQDVIIYIYKIFQQILLLSAANSVFMWISHMKYNSDEFQYILQELLFPLLGALCGSVLSSV